MRRGGGVGDVDGGKRGDGNADDTEGNGAPRALGFRGGFGIGKDEGATGSARGGSGMVLAAVGSTAGGQGSSRSIGGPSMVSAAVGTTAGGQGSSRSIGRSGMLSAAVGTSAGGQGSSRSIGITSESDSWRAK